jgi:NAD-dependent SIR2 family protein deacetylase
MAESMPHSIVILTGAGISQESGLDIFRRDLAFADQLLGR